MECPPLTEVVPPVDMGKLLNKTVDVAQAYNECRAKHQALIEWSK